MFPASYQTLQTVQKAEGRPLCPMKLSPAREPERRSKLGRFHFDARTASGAALVWASRVWYATCQSLAINLSSRSNLTASAARLILMNW